METNDKFLQTIGSFRINVNHHLDAVVAAYGRKEYHTIVKLLTRLTTGTAKTSIGIRQYFHRNGWWVGDND